MCAVFIFSWCSRKAAYSVWDVHDIVAANLWPWRVRRKGANVTGSDT